VDISVYHDYANDKDRARCQAEAATAKNTKTEEDAGALARIRKNKRVAKLAEKATLSAG